MHQLSSRMLLSAILSAALALAPGRAQAQDASLPRNPNIVIDYIEPMDPARLNFDREDSSLPREIKEKLAQVQANYEAMKGVRERLMGNRLLERFSLFLAPLRLPATLRLRTRQCDEANAENGAIAPSALRTCQAPRFSGAMRNGASPWT